MVASPYNVVYTIYVRRYEMEKEQRKEIAQTIINQLGGRRFMLMTGVKQFIMEECGVSFKIGRNGSKSNHVVVEYDYGRDLYNLVFGKIYNGTYKELERTDGIYFDMLEELFENYTGLYLRL